MPGPDLHIGVKRLEPPQLREHLESARRYEWPRPARLESTPAGWTWPTFETTFSAQSPPAGLLLPLIATTNRWFIGQELDGLKEHRLPTVPFAARSCGTDRVRWQTIVPVRR